MSLAKKTAPIKIQDIVTTVRRFFLVGCPRSGTTLAQTMLAQHPAVFTFPESHYFGKIHGRFPSQSHLVSPRAAARALDALAASLPEGTRRPLLPRWWIGLGGYARTFRNIVDDAATQQGREVWLEKSPIHLYHLETIKRYHAGVGILHILRDGRDVVASLVDLSLSDPVRWAPQIVGKGARTSGRVTLIAAAVARWNRDLGISLKHLDRSDTNLLFTYERLVERPRDTLSEICRFMGLEYDDAMERHWESAEDVVGWRSMFSHMDKVFTPVEDRRLRRFSVFFTPSEQEEIKSTLLYGGNPQVAIAQAG